jgi:hypothetical protein
VLHSITARFCLRPSFCHVDFHFRTYKRDLAILTEWWQQYIAWWELLNAACQIICIRKQHRYEAYSAGQTVPSTAQIRAEGNNTKCVGKKRFNGSVTHGLRKEHVLRSPFLDKVRSFFFLLMVICNSLLLLKSLPINVINCIKFCVNCSALTGTYDCQ